MSERDRQNPYARNQQQGGYRGNEGYESPRQANQWQADENRQQGGDWQQSFGQRGSGDDYTRDYRFSGQNRDGAVSEGSYRARLSDDDLRNDQRQAAHNYNSGRQHDWQGGNYGADRDRRPQAYRSPDYEASGGNDFGNFTSEDYGGRDFYNRGGSSVSGGLRPSDTYRPSYGLSSWRARDDRHDRHDSRSGGRDYGDWRSYGESRGFLARAGDEVASWFGSEDAARRREQDHREDHSGRGPSGYTRSDDRIREDANDALTHDWGVDATHVTVSVNGGEVTLDGTVVSRQAKRRAEDAVERVSGVKHVQNNLRVRESQSDSRGVAAGGGVTASGNSLNQTSGQTSGAGTLGSGATSGATGTVTTSRAAEKNT